MLCLSGFKLYSRWVPLDRFISTGLLCKRIIYGFYSDLTRLAEAAIVKRHDFVLLEEEFVSI